MSRRVSLAVGLFLFVCFWFLILGFCFCFWFCFAFWFPRGFFGLELPVLPEICLCVCGGEGEGAGRRGPLFGFLTPIVGDCLGRPEGSVGCLLASLDKRLHTRRP